MAARGPCDRTGVLPEGDPPRAPAAPQVAIVELPFDFVSDENHGGAGGTCVIRGCVPKKLLVYACVRKKILRGGRER